MIKYGLISKIDSECIEATLNYIMSDFPNEYINVTEVGCYGGDTGKGICEYIFSKKRIPIITGIDNNRDGEENRFKYDKLIIGNSSEVYNQIENNSQHFILIDGGHTFPQVVADFYSFQSKVKVGSYLCFHDTGKHIDPLSGWQGVGDKNDSDMCLGGVRKALEKIGLLYNARFNWRLIFDESDVTDSAGGVCIFKKIDKWD